MFHGQGEFGQEISRLGPDNRGPKNAITAFCGQHLYNPLCGAIGNGAVKIIEIIARDLISHALGSGLTFRQANAGNFGIGKNCKRNGAIIGFAALNIPKQRVYGGVIGLMACRMGKLIRACDIASGEDVGEKGLQIVIRVDLAICDNPQFLKAKPRQARAAPDCHQKIIGKDHLTALWPFDFHGNLITRTAHGLRRGACFDGNPIALYRGKKGGADLLILARQKPRRAFDLCDLNPKPCEALRQFAANRPTP